MTKNIKQIEELSKQLHAINQAIAVFISSLNKIKKENNIFTIKTMKDHPITNDLNLYCYCDLLLSFNINNQIHDFSFFGAKLSYLNIAHIDNNLKKILDFIDENLGLNYIQQVLSSALALYHNIKVIYKEIDFQNSDFTKNSTMITAYFKQLVKSQTIENNPNHKYAYLKLRKDNSSELIDFSYKETFDSTSLQIKFPIWNDIEKFLIDNNLDKSTYNYENTFKEQLFLLNKNIFELFNISPKSMQFYITKNKDDIYHNYNFKYLFLINSIKKDDINIIAKKIELRDKIANF